MIMGTFFDVEETYARLDDRDRLLKLNQWIPWESLRQVLGEITFVGSSRGGRPAWDPLLIAKCLILQSCYQLSDEELEYQINDRLSFKRFLGLDVAAKAPDAKTIWLYRERMKDVGLERKIFDWFSNVLDQNGVVAQKGQIVDATFVPTHKPTGKHTKQEKAGMPLSAAQKAQGTSKNLLSWPLAVSPTYSNPHLRPVNCGSPCAGSYPSPQKKRFLEVPHRLIPTRPLRKKGP